MNSRKLLIALAIIHEGKWQEIFTALQNHEQVDEEVADGYIKHIKSGVLTIFDPQYPDYLKHSYKPPFVLFYYGDISLISNKDNNVAVVGSRSPSIQGKENIQYIVEGIAKRYNIVSGLARGIDAVAHRTAIESGGKTIAVLGNGIEYCYPSENGELYQIIRKNHLVISEYFNYVSPDSTNFPQRNRLIVAFSKGTIIGEARKRSGTLITANFTLQDNQNLMSLPSGDIHDSLNNLFVREGCPLVLSPEDVFEYLDDDKNSLLCEVK